MLFFFHILFFLGEFYGKFIFVVIINNNISFVQISVKYITPKYQPSKSTIFSFLFKNTQSSWNQTIKRQYMRDLSGNKYITTPIFYVNAGMPHFSNFFYPNSASPDFVNCNLNTIENYKCSYIFHVRSSYWTLVYCNSG
jgi:hypothetical protein